MPNASGTAVSLHTSPEDEWGEGYVIAGAETGEISTICGMTEPTCPPASAPTPARSPTSGSVS